ncbi:hypothetical protein, partial [Pseudomonas aeruginosa]
QADMMIVLTCAPSATLSCESLFRVATRSLVGWWIPVSYSAPLDVRHRLPVPQKARLQPGFLLSALLDA